MSSKTVLCCMFGGKSTEYEVSLASAYSVITNVNRDIFDVVTVGITKDGKWWLYTGDVENIRNDTWHSDEKYLTKVYLSLDYGDKEFVLVDKDGKTERKKIDVIFPVMHGANSEDGTLQGLFELSGIPFVGPACASSAISMDKAYTKLVLSNYKHIKQADYIIVGKSDICDVDSIKRAVNEKFSYPVFVKPANAGSSVGVGKVMSEDDLEQVLTEALKYDRKVLIEEFIGGKEVEIAIMGNDSLSASPCGEIDPGSEFYDYETKYKNDTAKYYIPARVTAATMSKIDNLAKDIYRILGCKGLSRVDFFVRGEGENEEVVFNEINTLPGFTSISMYPKLFKETGMTYSEIITNLVNLAME